MKITSNYSILCVTLYRCFLIRLVESADTLKKYHNKLNQGIISFLIAHRSNLKDVKRIISTHFASEKEGLVFLGTRSYDYYRIIPKNLRDPHDSVFRLSRALYSMSRNYKS